MTRKEAIKVVVANVKLGWVPKRWVDASVGLSSMGDGRVLRFYVGRTRCYLSQKPRYSTCTKRWFIPRAWLEARKLI